MKNLKNDIDNKSFKQIYLLYGEEEYLKNYYKNALIKAVTNDDKMNLSIFDSENMDMNELKSIIGTLPFFSDRRLVVINDSKLFEKSDEDFIKRVNEAPQQNHLLFIESKVDKRNKLYKLVNERGYVCELNTPDEKMLVSWIRQYVKKYSKEISLNDAEILLSKAGKDMYNLENEILKLINYTGDKSVIEKKDIDEAVHINIEDKVFELVSSVVNNDGNKALKIYDELVGMKFPYRKMLALISGEFIKLFKVKSMINKRMNSKDIETGLKLSSKAVYVISKNIKNISYKYLFDKVNECMNIDEAIKSGNISEDTAIELLIFGS